MGEHSSINVKVKVHRPTGMLAAYSDELSGLLVIGANEHEIETKLPGAIRELMEAMGTPVTDIELVPVNESDTEWVSQPKFRADLNRAA